MHGLKSAGGSYTWQTDFLGLKTKRTNIHEWSILMFINAVLSRHTSSTQGVLR